MYKKMLNLVLGILFGLISLILLISFLVEVATPPLLFDPNPMPAISYVLWVLFILAGGAPAFFFLRAAIRGFRGAAIDDDDDDDDDADDDDDRGDYDDE